MKSIFKVMSIVMSLSFICIPTFSLLGKEWVDFGIAW